VAGLEFSLALPGLVLLGCHQEGLPSSGPGVAISRRNDVWYSGIVRDLVPLLS
jgi:hypothetical protein